MATKGKRGAPAGNKNAAGGKGGARTAALGSLFLGGPVGAAIGGAYVGATKQNRAMVRHRRMAAGIGAVGGALAGTMVMPVVGTALGAIGGGAFNYVGARVGQAAGRAIKRRR